MKNLEHFKRFNDVIQSVLEPGNPEYKSLAGYVGRLLIQFKLRGSYEIAEIINIAYCRGIDAIDAGKEIYNPVAWLKRTCLHVIHELSRSRKKVQSLDEEGAPQPSVDDSALAEEMMQVDLKTIRLALKELSPSDRKLLRMRVIEGSSWREISHELALVTGGESDKEGTLRQRGYRSLLRLREIYDDIRPEQKNYDA